MGGGSRVDWALDHVHRGFAVFPLKPWSKKPATRNGFKDATTDPDRVRALWAKAPDSNIGLAVPAGLVVIDVDNKNGRSGDQALAELEDEFEPLPDTLTAETANSGWHLFFTIPDGAPALVQRDLVDGVINTRVGGKGYVVGAGSVVHSESDGAGLATYAWCNDLAPAPCPQWVIELLAARPSPIASAPRSPGALPQQPPGLTSYVSAALRSETERVANAVNGTRHRTLNSAACALGKYVHHRLMERHYVVDQLMAAARDSGLLEDDGTQQCRRQIERGLAFGANRPLPDALRLSSTDTTKIHTTELGNAQRFELLANGRVRYAHDVKSWLIFDGRRWLRDQKPPVWRLMASVAEQVQSDAKTVFAAAAAAGERPKMGKPTPLTDRANRLLAWGMRSESSATTQGSLRVAAMARSLADRWERYDTDGDVLNTPGGIIDLRRPLAPPHPHDAMRRMSKITRGSVKHRSGSSHWALFLADALPDESLRRYVQCLVGMSLLGNNPERAIVLLYGDAGTGKTTFAEAIGHALGDYAVTLASDALQKPRGGRDQSSHNAGLMPLKGARFAFADELPSGARLDEQLIKTITGSRTLRMRAPHEHTQEFPSTATIFIASNDQPHVSDKGDAFWERWHVVPFVHATPTTARDRRLGEKLRAEADIVLAWLLDGLSAYLSDGLPPCHAVKRAVAEHRGGEDHYRTFVDEVFEKGDRTLCVDVNAAATEWFSHYGYRRPNASTLGRHLTRLGYPRGGQGNLYRLGLRLKRDNGHSPSE